MKQTFAVVIFVIIVSLISIYFFIPGKMGVVNEIQAACSVGTLQRITGSTDYRLKWLPKAGKVVSAVEYVLDGCTYLFPTDNSFNNNITVKYKNITTHTLVTILPLADSVLLSWVFTHKSSNNPIARVADYFAFKHIKATNQKMLQSMLVFLSVKKNVYGFEVSEQKQTDSTLITIKAKSATFPTVKEIYTNIEKLRQYAVSNAATTTNAPMLNIENGGDGVWHYMVALPIDKALDNTGDIVAKRMLAGGKILITENITGGFSNVDKAFKQFEIFKSDNNYKSPAIPFQSLVTDRMKESDSSKWITRLYYPVY